MPIVGASDHTVTHCLYIEDPDGNEIELYIDVQPAIWHDEPMAVLVADEAFAVVEDLTPTPLLIAERELIASSDVRKPGRRRRPTDVSIVVAPE